MLLRGLALSALLALSVGFAQSFYAGATLGTPVVPDANPLRAAELGVQLGVDVISVAGVRAYAEANLVDGVQTIGTDVLFRFYPPLTYSNFYTGIGGVALFQEGILSQDDLYNAVPAIYVPIGYEWRTGGMGLFGEVQPSLLLWEDFSSRSAYFVRLRAGINAHF